jgi:phosphoribosylamine--glycine ligase
MRTAIGVVMAAEGYPGTPRKGDTILTPDETNEDVKVFHAGSQLVDGIVKTAGGRVLCVTALAHTLKQARQVAYQRVASIQFVGAQYRRDIGWRALGGAR